jgi:hypothetical protein
MSQCTAIKRGGERCKGVAIDTSGLCYSHSPNHADARKRAARKGGQRGGRGRPQTQLASLILENADIRARVLRGEIMPNVGAVTIQSINAAIRAVKVGLEVQEQQDLEERLAELEVAYEQRGQRRWG